MLTTDMIKNIILTNPRCGSSYFTNGMKRASQLLDPNHVGLGEAFSPKKHPLWLDLVDNKLKVNKSEIREPELEFHDLVHRIEHTQKLMLETDSPFTAKIHVGEYRDFANRTLFWDLIKQSNTRLFFLYRRDIEDSILSFLLIHLNRPNTLYYDRTRHLPFIRNHIRNHADLRDFGKLHSQYIDHTLVYEDLDGKDFHKDFQPYFDQTIPDEFVIANQKLYSKEDKIRIVINYEDFKKDFDHQLEREYGRV